MATNKQLRMALVGLGYWGPNHLKTYYQMESVKIMKVCDLRPDRWEKIKAKYPDLTYVNNLDSVLTDQEIEAVAVVTDVETHFKITKKCLEAGKHVFVEKPIAQSSREVEELIRLAESQKKVLMVGHLLEYHPAVRELKELMRRNELGKILYGYSVRVNLGKVRSRENALWSLAPHDISVLLYLLGLEPDSVTAVGKSFLRKGVEDLVFVTLQFPDGIFAHLHLSWLDPHKIRKITIVGDKKMCVFDDMEPVNKLKIFHNEAIRQEKFDFYDEEYVKLKEGGVDYPILPKTSPLRLECEHFVNCVLEGKTPLSDGRDGLRVIKVIERIQQALDKR